MKTCVRHEAFADFPIYFSLWCFAAAAAAYVRNYTSKACALAVSDYIIYPCSCIDVYGTHWDRQFIFPSALRSCVYLCVGARALVGNRFSFCHSVKCYHTRAELVCKKPIMQHKQIRTAINLCVYLSIYLSLSMNLISNEIKPGHVTRRNLLGFLF